MSDAPDHISEQGLLELAVTVSRDTITFYVDGREVATNATTGNDYKIRGAPDNKPSLIIGQHGSSGLDWSFQGEVSEVAVFNAPLSASEIKGMFDMGKP